jgi:uncharacterized repeat protein (TIGR01451 family)
MRYSNWMMRAVVLAAIAVAMVAVPARAQTPEGTVITNTATVNYQDANGRAYTPASASVSVTVGFRVGIDVTSTANVTPPSPSSGQSITFPVTNIGNGPDTVQVTESISNAAVITVTGYQINGAGTVYGTLAALNTALLLEELAGVGGSLTITVIYDVNAGQGGQNTDYTLTATSQRDGTGLGVDAATTNIAPPTAFGVAVTPDGGTVQQLPSGGTYTQTFTVQNTGNVSETFDLTGSDQTLGVIAILTVNGVVGTTAQVTIASGASAAIDVTYTVAEVAVGSTERLTLTAQSQTQPATQDDGYVNIEVIRPTVTIAKQVYRSDQSTVIGPTDEVVPGEVIWYRVSVTNTGNQNAASVHVDDLLPAELAFLALANDGSPGWTLTNSGNDVDADLTVALAAGVTRFFWIQARVN